MRTDGEQGGGPGDGAGRGARARAWRVGGPWIVSGAMVLVIALIVVVMATSASMNTAPAWWQTVSSADPIVVEDAQELENAIITQLHLRRDASQTEWWVALPAEDANAWLAARLPKWVAGQMFQGIGEELPEGVEPELDVWPDELAEVQVSFRHPHILVGARVEEGGRSRYFSATLSPELREDGTLWLVAERVQVGRLSVPASWVLSEAERRADEIVPEAFRGLPEAEAFFQIFAGERPFADEPQIRLGDGRRVRLLAVRSSTDKNRLEVKCRTEYSSGGGPDERASVEDGAAGG